MPQTKTTKSNLPPLDLKEEVERYEARGEQKEIKFDKCEHRDVKFRDDMLACPCGASWQGERLGELFDLLTKKR